MCGISLSAAERGGTLSEVQDESRQNAQDESAERIVPVGAPDRGAENLVLVLLGIAVLFAVGFIVTYAEFSPVKLPNELLGICLGGAFLFIALALTVVSRRLVVTEEVEKEYPADHE